MVFQSEFAQVKPDEKHKDLVSNFFWHQLDKFSERVLFVDFASGREWTGGQIKRRSASIAHNLIHTCHLKPEADTITFWYHNDEMQLLSLGLLFAGAGVCVVAPEDPESEHEYVTQVMRAALVFVEHKLLAELLAIRARCQLNFDLVVMDDDKLDERQWGQLEKQVANSVGANDEKQPQPQKQSARLFGFHKHLFDKELATVHLEDPSGTPTLPVQVDPDRPAFVLLTSGSTGRPKPVVRSQRNSLYVCHSFYGAQVARVWQLNEQVVMAGHLQLDHGTGTFCLKQALAHGLKLILMHGYEYATLLEAIRRYRITDCLLGSALLHNFVTAVLAASQQDTPPSGTAATQAPLIDLSSLRTFLAIGGPIASRTLVAQFMEVYPGCSIRQAYGMTEAGFVAVAPREPPLQDTVGSLLPNLEVKLLQRLAERPGVELDAFNEEGELYVRGPTVSPGYLGEQFREQARASFLADGFYKTNDICRLLQPGCQLQIRGRFSEILCLHDGWKVLPSEIEQNILAHPQVKEAVVLGIPHPELPTCHAARAYVVPKEGVPADFDLDFQQQLDDVLAGRLQLPAAGTPTASNHIRELEEGTNGLLMAQHFRRLQRDAAAAASKTAEQKAEQKLEQPERLSKQQLFNYTGALMSEPKHLVGGIRILRQLPRISIGKFDKKLLRKLDGFS